VKQRELYKINPITLKRAVVEEEVKNKPMGVIN
jgi:hypothetical protein